MLKNLLREFGNATFHSNFDLDYEKAQIHNLTFSESATSTVVSSVNGVAAFVAKKTNSNNTYVWFKTKNVIPNIGLGFGVYAFHGTDTGGVGSGTLPICKGDVVSIYGNLLKENVKHLIIVPFKTSK